MAISNTTKLRSISLPSRLNPSFSQIEINLNMLKTLEPFNPTTRIHSGLVCLIDLYVSVDELIGSSHTQNADLHHRNKAMIEDALDRSTRLMDTYSDLVELLAQTKQNLRVLQFALRRKGVGTYATSESHLLDYLLSRKKAKKNVIRCIGSLEQLERKTDQSYYVIGEDDHLSTIISVLGQIVIATLSMFRYVLLVLSGKPKLEKGFSMITKLMATSKQRTCHQTQEIINEADIIDNTLVSLRKNIKKNEVKTVEVQTVIDRLHKLDSQIEGYEVGLDSLFRKLIQTRVSLLNILAN